MTRSRASSSQLSHWSRSVGSSSSSPRSPAPIRARTRTGEPAMAPLTVTGIDELRELIGKPVGPSEWVEVTQADIDKFAEVSRDDQWIHVDVERAERESPFGTTVAHGNLTLSLIDGFRGELITQRGV